MQGVFASLNLSMPATLASYRQLAEAQDLTTAAGRETYALLLKLAPAFADLQSSLEGSKSAADIATERADLERQLLQLQGNTAALRARDLAKVDASNRMLQEQIWGLQDAEQAAKAAEELRKAWTSVGDSIMDEVRRIRGLDTAAGGGSFASLLGRFNAITAAARGGDMDAAKDLPKLSQALLAAAANSATSRQELARVQAQTAASLEATFGAIGALSTVATATTNAALLGAAGTSQAANSASNDNGTETLADKLDELRGELERLRSDNNAGLAAVAGNTGRTARKLDDVTAASGGDAISTVAAA
jgi:ribosomal protein L29